MTGSAEMSGQLLTSAVNLRLNKRYNLPFALKIPSEVISHA
jgi:hypothetical protein